MRKRQKLSVLHFLVFLWIIFSWSRLYESVVFLQLPQPLKPNTILEGIGKYLVFFEVHAHATYIEDIHTALYIPQTSQHLGAPIYLPSFFLKEESDIAVCSRRCIKDQKQKELYIFEIYMKRKKKNG